MKTLYAMVLTLGLLAASGFAQPTIVQIQNAASNAVNPLPGSGTGECNCEPLPNGAIAQGSYFSIYGSGIGPTAYAFWNPYPLPTSLSQTSVNVTVNGTSVAAYLEFVYATQINAVLPSNTPTGTGTIAVTYNGATSATFPITVTAMSFGTFSINEAGSGPGILTNAVTNVLVTPFTTVAPGDYVTIWGTGLGAVDATTEGTAPPVQNNLCGSGSNCPVTVWVGPGLKAVVTYAGRSPYTAEDQIDFIVPATGVQGCYVQVAVQTGDIVGNFTSLAVDPTGPTCSDTDGINYGDLAPVIASTGKASVGAISLLSNFLNLSLLGSSLQWDNDTVSGEIATFTTSQLDTFQGLTLVPSVGNCSVSPFLGFPPPKDPVLSQLTFLDAGPNLSIQGPNGTQSVAQNCTPVSTTGCGTSGRGYSGLVGGSTIANLLQGTSINPFFLSDTGWPGTGSSYVWTVEPGTFTVTGSGGAAVGALSAPITVSSGAAAFQWTNRSTVTAGAISRSTPLTITWSGGDPNGFVDITAIASTLLGGTEPPAITPGILVECIAPASAQTFTIPTYVLQTLPSTSGSSALVPPGELLVGPASGPVKVTAPSGLNELYIFYHYIAGDAVTWQ